MRKLTWEGKAGKTYEEAQKLLQERLVNDSYGSVEAVRWARDIYNEKPLDIHLSTWVFPVARKSCFFGRERGAD